MKKLIFKMKSVLKMSITIMFMVVIFVDDSILNSMVIQYDSNDMVVEEVAATIVERSTSQLSGQAVSASYEEKEDTNKLSGQVVINNEEIVSTYVTMLSVSQNKSWSWPTNSNYVITSYYGYRGGKLHGAIDISGAGYGSSIYAANSGVVTTVKGGCVTGDLSCNSRAGNYIVIKHNINNYYTVYMHLKDIYVKVGQTVSNGQVVGTMGNTGNVYPVPTSSSPYSGTHLHFAVYVGEPYKGGYTINPMNLY